MASIADQVSKLPRFGRIEYFLSVASTNALALQRLSTDNDCLCISFVTESQENGRGRSGRKWLSPPASGLLVSTILPGDLPSRTLPAIGFWSALAVRAACLAATGITLELKWPNDLLLEGRKCVGILSQGRSAGGASRVVVGVGINVNRPAAVPPEISETASWLSEKRGEVDRNALLAALLGTYERRFEALLQRPEAVIEAWARLAQLNGKTVSIRSTDQDAARTGTVKEIASDGALILEVDGKIARVTLGDVDVLR
ncbi:MAG: biotin--[acetyl-CoA-carboxylase] ligase [Candidatus Eremiobacter antarcticus]|nr:biotin--[acetyl-CoA-carboxylase] ligase [Candidatus Eremiobacteraeota bacterium]MBC5808025.1 biotin--[acetyl-CoA-carboxylase] ligase [Candidatus Eremiobacteraeota bacterium]